MIPDVRGLIWLALFGFVCAMVLGAGVSGLMLWHFVRALALYLGAGG